MKSDLNHVFFVFLEKEKKKYFSLIVFAGPGLAFIAFPRAVSLMPLPQLWAIFFFVMIIFLGLDSEVSKAL